MKNVKKAGKVVRDVAGDTGKRVFDDAKTYYDRASPHDTGARFTRASTAATSGLLKARDWIRIPARQPLSQFRSCWVFEAGVAFPGLDAVLLGSASALANALRAAGLGAAQSG